MELTIAIVLIFVTLLFFKLMLELANHALWKQSRRNVDKLLDSYKEAKDRGDFEAMKELINESNKIA